MMHLAKRYGIMAVKPELLRADEEKKILIFKRKNLIFALNFNPVGSFADYGFQAPPGKYVKVLDSDEVKFDGFSRLGADGNTLPSTESLKALPAEPLRARAGKRRLEVLS